MKPEEVVLLLASRLPRGVGFVPLGRLEASTVQLETEVRLAGVVWLEVHSAAGMVTPAPVSRLAQLKSEHPGAAHLIGFTPSQLVELAVGSRDAQVPNLFSLLEADRTVCDASHQRRFLPPSELRAALTDGARLSVAPVDYSHRLLEIQRLIEQSGEGMRHAHTFLESAAKYAEASTRPEELPEMEVHLASDELPAAMPEAAFLKKAVVPPSIDDDAAVEKEDEQLKLL